MSLSTAFQAFLLFIVWNRRTQNDGALSVYFSFLKMAVLSVGMGVLLEGARQTLASALLPTGKLENLLMIAGISIVWLGLLAAMGTLFRLDEVRQPLAGIWKESRRRLLRRN
jgi:hypothetical protein